MILTTGLIRSLFHDGWILFLLFFVSSLACIHYFTVVLSVRCSFASVSPSQVFPSPKSILPKPHFHLVSPHLVPLPLVVDISFRVYWVLVFFLCSSPAPVLFYIPWLLLPNPHIVSCPRYLEVVVDFEPAVNTQTIRVKVLGHAISEPRHTANVRQTCYKVPVIYLNVNPRR